MAHTTRYAFRGTSRLAADAGLNKATISLLVRGKCSPLYITAERIVNCLELELGRSFDLREVFSELGEYPTEHVCDLVGCRGCLPDLVYESDGDRRAKFADVNSGEWRGDTCEFNGALKEMVE